MLSSNCLIEGSEVSMNYCPKWNICQEEGRAMTGRCSHRTREQQNISSCRRERATLNRRPPPPPASWRSPGAFVAFMHLFPDGSALILPASGHAVKNEGWPQPDKADDKEKRFPGPQRTRVSPGGPQPAPTLAG